MAFRETPSANRITKTMPETYLLQALSNERGHLGLLQVGLTTDCEDHAALRGTQRLRGENLEFAHEMPSRTQFSAYWPRARRSISHLSSTQGNKNPTDYGMNFKFPTLSPDSHRRGTFHRRIRSGRRPGSGCPCARPLQALWISQRSPASRGLNPRPRPCLKRRAFVRLFLAHFGHMKISPGEDGVDCAVDASS